MKPSVAEQAQTIVELRQELQDCKRQLTEVLEREKATAKELQNALEQQTAKSEILRVIASSPAGLQPVLDTVIANAVVLAGA